MHHCPWYLQSVFKGKIIANCNLMWEDNVFTIACLSVQGGSLCDNLGKFQDLFKLVHHVAASEFLGFDWKAFLLKCT